MKIFLDFFPILGGRNTSLKWTHVSGNKFSTGDVRYAIYFQPLKDFKEPSTFFRPEV